MRDNFCESCTWWEFTHKDDDKKFGQCSNMSVEESVRITADFDSIENEDAPVFTESLFGCIHHEGKELVVARIVLPKK